MKRVFHKRRQKNAGFTLVEVLVALFIFSALSAATLSILTTTIKTKSVMEDKNKLLNDRAVLRLLLKADFAGALSVPKTDEYGRPELVFFGGGLERDRLLTLSRTGWDNPGGLERRSNLQAVDYVLKDGVLTRIVRARFNYVGSTPVYEQALLGGLRSVKFEFYDGKDWFESWQTGLPPNGVAGLPILAAAEFTFDDDKQIRQVFKVGADQ